MAALQLRLWGVVADIVDAGMTTTYDRWFHPRLLIDLAIPVPWGRPQVEQDEEVGHDGNGGEDDAEEEDEGENEEGGEEEEEEEEGDEDEDEDD